MPSGPSPSIAVKWQSSGNSKSFLVLNGSDLILEIKHHRNGKITIPVMAKFFSNASPSSFDEAMAVLCDHLYRELDYDDRRQWQAALVAAMQTALDGDVLHYQSSTEFYA